MTTTAMAMLERGDRRGAREVLARAFGDGSAPTPADGDDARLDYHLYLALEGRSAPPARATAATPAAPEPTPAGRGADALAHALLAADALRRGRTDALVEHAVAAHEASPPEYPWVGLHCASLLQAAYRFTGARDVRRRAAAHCRNLSDRTDVQHVAVPARTLLGSLHMMAGELPAALLHLEAAIDLAEATGLAEHASTALAHQFRGYVLLEWDRETEAEACLTRAWSLAGPDGRSVRSGVARVMASLCDSTGRRLEADRWIEALEELVSEPMSLRNREWLDAVRARRARGTGRVEAVEAWLRAYGYLDDSAEDPAERMASHLHEYEHVLTMLEAAGRWSDLLRLARVVSDTSPEDRRWFRARALAAEAIALQEVGRPAEAMDALRRAVGAGETGGFVRAYLDGGAERAALLARTGADVDPHAEPHLHRVCLAASRRASGKGLTPRQVDVLRLIDGGHSDKAIARALGLSVATVKTHLRAAYRRLGASSRTHALARARALGLL